MAAKKKATTKRKTTTKKTPAPSKPKETAGTVALVLRVPPEAIGYIDQKKGDRPRTAYLRDVLAKGDAGLAEVLA